MEEITVAHLVLAVVALISGVLIAYLAIASRRRTLPLNWVVGYRTHTVMTNEDVWIQAHYVASLWTGISAGACLIGAIGYLFTATDRTVLVWTIAWLVAMFAAIIVGAVVAQKTAITILA